MNEVVVTGIGLVTPLGLGREKTWRALAEGRSAVLHDAAMPGFCTARVGDLPVPAETRALSMAFLAAAEAVQDSGIDLRSGDPARIGCTVSVSKPDLTAKPLFMAFYSPSTIGDQLRRIFGLRGPARNITAACATGIGSVAIAAEWVRHGLCDIVIAGAVESSLHPLYLAAFKRMGVLCSEAVRPFDRRRDGFAMGEGAALLVLEAKGRASSRGAHIYGTIAGCALANDTHHPVAFMDNGETIAGAIRRVVNGRQIPAVGYIHAHGTATPLNDVIETRAIKSVFKRNAARLLVSSTKAATGHLLGASGALGTAVCLLALRDNIAPPTLNLAHPDPECDLDYVPRTMRSHVAEAALALSFGFGGQIGAVVVAR